MFNSNIDPTRNLDTYGLPAALRAWAFRPQPKSKRHSDFQVAFLREKFDSKQRIPPENIESQMKK